MIDPRRAALIIIDMQGGFIDESSALAIAGARASIPACARTLEAARNLSMNVIHVVRKYAVDGSDVEPVRRRLWLDGGKPLSDADPESLREADEIAPAPGEAVMVKPSFSAFFNTALDETLREEGIDTVVLIGTTTPNCIRSTCYDALSLGYNAIVVEDATSSRNRAVQDSNIEDMRFIGATILDSATFAAQGLSDVEDVVAEARKLIEPAR